MIVDDLKSQDTLTEPERIRLVRLENLLDPDEPELDEEATDDPLIDKWEREFAEGKIPNLDEDF